jgi:uncharacterized membrane protein YhaH (DUF805 family)
MNWYLMVLKNYMGFSGRARRKEYCMYTLFNVIIIVGLQILAAVMAFVSGTLATIFGLLIIVYSLGVLLPSIAVAIRRMHDTDRSGWWLLLGLVPLLGIVILVFACLPGTVGDNRFGPDPKAGESA